MSNLLPVKSKNRLKELRKDTGMTQERIAEKLGVTVKTYRSWENCEDIKGIGIRNISDLVVLAELFHVSVDYLLNKSEFRTPENEFIGKETGLTDESIFLLKEWNKKKIDLFIQKDLDTLNFILKECYCRQQTNKTKKHYLPERSILDLIGDYITKQAFKIAPLDRVTIKTATNDYITFEEGESPKVLGEPRDKKITDCVVSEIYDDRSETYGLCNPDYKSEDCIPVIYNDNEEMGVIQLDESLIEASIMNDIKNELDYLKELKNPDNKKP